MLMGNSAQGTTLAPTIPLILATSNQFIPTPATVQAHIPTIAAAPVAVSNIPALPARGQALPFAPGLSDEVNLLANSIVEKLRVLIIQNRPTALQDRPAQEGNLCNFCGQGNQYIHSCEMAARYISENCCKRDDSGHLVMMDEL